MKRNPTILLPSDRQDLAWYVSYVVEDGVPIKCALSGGVYVSNPESTATAATIADMTRADGVRDILARVGRRESDALLMFSSGCPAFMGYWGDLGGVVPFTRQAVERFGKGLRRRVARLRSLSQRCVGGMACAEERVIARILNGAAQDLLDRATLQFNAVRPEYRKDFTRRR